MKEITIKLLRGYAEKIREDSRYFDGRDLKKFVESLINIEEFDYGCDEYDSDIEHEMYNDMKKEYELEENISFCSDSEEDEIQELEQRKFILENKNK